MVGEAKLLGSAQRRIPGCVMQHGSLILDRRFDAHPGTHLHNPPAEQVAGWIDAFVTRVAERLGLLAAAGEWTPTALADVAERRRKFAGNEWNALR